MGTPFQSLRSLAWYWGGDIHVVTEEDYKKVSRREDFYEAPFAGYSLGVLWKGRRVITTSASPPYPDIIHEMGHLFACKKSPVRSDEFEFLGWEFAMAKYIKAPMAQWYLCMSDYSVNGGTPFKELSEKDQKRCLEDRVEVATKSGLLDRGVPMAIR